MKEAQYGFNCGVFSVVMAADNVIIPGGKSAPLRKSYLPPPNTAEGTAGHYTMRATHHGAIVCEVPVQVLWVTHDREPEPFIGLRCADHADLFASLKVYEGKALELAFTKRAN